MLLPVLIGMHAALTMQPMQTMEAPPAAPLDAAASVPAPLEAPVLFADLSDEDVLARAAAAIQGLDTLRAGFTQISPTGNVTTGTLAMDRPGRLRFDYDAPSAQRIVATGGLVYVHDGDLETTDSYPLGKTPLRFLLSDDIGADGEGGVAGAVLTGVARMPGEVAVALQATDEELSGEVALVFAGPEDALQLVRWAVVDPQGGVTEVALRDVETDVKLSRRLFRIPEAERRFGSDRR